MRKRKYPDLPERSHPDYARLYRERNKEELKEKGKIKYQANREAFLEKQRERYDPAAAAEYRRKNRKRMREHNWQRHGIVDFTYEKYLSELTQQDNRCKICDCIMEMPQVDHDHQTGKYRGLLCKTCNFGLGIYENNKEKFEKYLIEHSRLTT